MLSLNPECAPSLIENLWPKDKLRSKEIICGINEDDCSIIRIGDKIIGITTDFLNSKPICLEFNIATYYDLGKLTVASNLADLLGSGLKPHSFMLGLMLKRAISEEDFLFFIKGVKSELDKYDIPLIGGDTKLGQENAFIGMAIGEAKNTKELFLKNRANIDDVVYVSGELGSVAASIAFLKSKYANIKKYEKLKLWSQSALIKPSLPYDLSRSLSKLELSLSGTDVSDGLSADLYNLCDTSKVGAIIYSNLIPTNNNTKKIASLLEIEDWKFPFLTGGDFQFIFTINSKDVNKLNGFNCFEIGKITKDTGVFLKNKTIINKLDNFGHSDSNNVSFAKEISIHLNKI